MSAFDFPLRYRLKDMCDSYGYSLRRLAEGGTVVAERPDRAVTFVDNHDFRGGDSTPDRQRQADGVRVHPHPSRLSVRVLARLLRAGARASRQPARHRGAGRRARARRRRRARSCATSTTICTSWSARAGTPRPGWCSCSTTAAMAGAARTSTPRAPAPRFRPVAWCRPRRRHAAADRHRRRRPRPVLGAPARLRRLRPRVDRGPLTPSLRLVGSPRFAGRGEESGPVPSPRLRGEG